MPGHWLRPFKVIRSRANLEMIFHNTKIELCAETGAGCRRMKEMDENTLMEEKIIKLYKKWKGGLIKMLYPQLFFIF